LACNALVLRTSHFTAILIGLCLKIAETIAQQGIAIVTDLALIFIEVEAAPFDILGGNADIEPIGN
jgi:hypothetical protein